MESLQKAMAKLEKVPGFREYLRWMNSLSRAQRILTGVLMLYISVLCFLAQRAMGQ